MRWFLISLTFSNLGFVIINLATHQQPWLIAFSAFAAGFCGGGALYTRSNP